MKKRILLFSTLSPYPFWAGSEKFWFDLVTDERTRERFEFHTRLAESPVTREKAELLKAAGAEVSFYKHFNVDFMRRNIARAIDRLAGRTVRTLPWYDEIRRGKYDLVWFNVDCLNNLQELEYAVSMCKRKRVPFWLVLQHGSESFFLDSASQTEVVEEISVSASRFVFIAGKNRESLERAVGRRLENAFHSANALTTSELRRAGKIAADFPANGERGVRLFSLGRYSTRDKGQHLIIETLSRPEWQRRDWKMSFVGVDDAGRKQLKRMAIHFGLENSRLDFVAFTNDVYAEIGRHDVLVMPSLAEGMPFAMIESMASGRPVAGTPVGGIPELIRDGETGWLARTTDVADIAVTMERMWSDREKWPEMGSAARKHVVTYNDQTKTHAELLDALTEDLG